MNPIAELHGNNQVTKRFVYATRWNVPDAMIVSGVAYRLITDRLGSVRWVVRVSDGTAAQVLAYDEFGRVLSDTNPGFQPFGFAGGLTDRSTGLVHFGAREYDPESGRWISKDPILFAGGDPNLYGYVLNDPVNGVDPSGLKTIVHAWDPSGDIRSSFGHISVSIDDTSFSFGERGMDIRPADDYAALQYDFRGETAYTLGLAAEQEDILYEFLMGNRSGYWSLWNNCGDPLEDFLESQGFDMGINITPAQLIDGLNSNCLITEMSRREKNQLTCGINGP